MSFLELGAFSCKLHNVSDVYASYLKQCKYMIFFPLQDTVVALQALALYSSLQTSSSRLDMGLALEGDELVRGFRLEEESRLVTQTVRVPVLPALLDMQAVGEGCALVQVRGTIVISEFKRWQMDILFNDMGFLS